MTRPPGSGWIVMKVFADMNASYQVYGTYAKLLGGVFELFSRQEDPLLPCASHSHDRKPWGGKVTHKTTVLSEPVEGWNLAAELRC